jgi:hypothetical protein
MFIFFCVVLSGVGRGLYDGVITRPKESHRHLPVDLCNVEVLYFP